MSHSAGDAAAAASLLAAFDGQAAWCHSAQAPFTARLLARSRLWLARTPEALDALAAVSSDPLAGAVALRWASALHHLALRGLAPWAGLWPPAAFTGSEAGLDAALDACLATAWQQQRPLINAALARAPQTNEVQRSAALLPGLLHIAARTGGRPMALLEIGASAGLNLWCERYPQENGVWCWPGRSSEPVLRSAWTGPAPPMASLTIVQRAACDLHPVHLQQPGEALRLASYLWPEQGQRLRRFHAAASAAQRWAADSGVMVQASPAADFVEQQLASRPQGLTTVLMHSVVWQYLPASEQQRINEAMLLAGGDASADTPLAWLRMEPPDASGCCELRATRWPGAADERLALTHPHGNTVQWLQGPERA